MDNNYKLSGTLIWIGELKQFSQYFSKREFKIRRTDINSYTNRLSERKIKFEIQNDNIPKIESARIDDTIDIHFNIDGKDYVKDGKEINFTSLVAYEIDIINSISRDTKEDKEAVITNEGRKYPEKVTEVTDEQLLGSGFNGPLPEKKVKDKPKESEPLVDPFASIEEKKENIDYEPLPF